MLKKLSYTFLMGVFLISLSGCGGDSTGPDVGEPPQIPSLEQAKPDLSFFEENNPQKGNAVQKSINNYSQAQFALIYGSFLNLGLTYGMYLDLAEEEKAVFKDGMWEWSYTYGYEGMEASYRVTAKKLQDAAQWAAYWSYNDGQGGGFKDYKFIEGTIRNDGSGGNWTFNMLNPELTQEVPYISTEWTVSGETEKEITIEVFGEEEGAKSATVYYAQNGVNFEMTYSFADGTETVIVWNTETNVGYVTQDGTKKCWDENFQDVACS